MGQKGRQLQWVRAPRQARSERTLHRLLDATEALLADRSFEQISVADVVKRARSSVGSFYARFANKEQLLDCLYDRHQEEAMATVASGLDPTRWVGVAVQELVATIVRFATRLYRENRGLLRALVLRGHVKPDRRYLHPRFRGVLAVSRVAELVSSRAREIRHPDPKLAAGLGFLMVLATLREKILFADSTASAVKVSDAQLERELVRAYLSYLGVAKSRTARFGPRANRKRKGTSRPSKAMSGMAGSKRRR